MNNELKKLIAGTNSTLTTTKRNKQHRETKKRCKKLNDEIKSNAVNADMKLKQTHEAIEKQIFCKRKKIYQTITINCNRVMRLRTNISATKAYCECG